ncbi:hypothetical protein BS17DRAFT_791024, partial [Gyrodon lividus]
WCKLAVTHCAVFCLQYVLRKTLLCQVVTSRNFPNPSDTILAPYDQIPNPKPWTLP